MAADNPVPLCANCLECGREKDSVGKAGKYYSCATTECVRFLLKLTAAAMGPMTRRRAQQLEESMHHCADAQLKSGFHRTVNGGHETATERVYGGSGYLPTADEQDLWFSN